MIKKQLRDAGFRCVDGVWVRQAREAFGYSDGDAEEEGILAALQSMKDVSLASAELSAHAGSWAARYHLSAARAQIARPLDDVLGKTVLELGAGCGAVTRWLGESGRTVVAVEGSYRRARICRERCRDLDNVTVVCDRIEKLPVTATFDAVTLIGVLEYAAMFGLPGDAPDKALLDKARSWCAQDGILAVAIENRLGLKYWAGAPEDHLGLPLVGVHAAYKAGEPRTYSQVELKALLESVGFSEQAFLLPFPDYKFPSVVLYPRSSWQRHRDLTAELIRFSNRSDPQPYDARFSTEALWPTLAREGALSTMANSFLVVTGSSGCKRVRSVASSKTIAVHYGGQRVAEFRKETTFVAEDEQVIVERRGHANGAVDGARIVFPEREALAPGRPWVAELHAITRRDGWRFEELVEWASFWLQRFFQELRARGLAQPTTSTVIPSDLLDAGPQNLLVDDEGTARFVDLEWSIQTPVTVGFVAFRSLLWSLMLITWSAPTTNNAFTTLGSALPALMSGMGLDVSESALEDWLAQEEAFQSLVSGTQVRLTRETLRRRWGGPWRRRSDGSDGLAFDDLDVRVYTSDGETPFAEQSLVRAQCALETHFTEIEVAIADEGVRTLRVHPAAGLGVFKLRAVKIGTGETLTPYAIAQLVPSECELVALRGGDFAVVCIGGDPSLRIDLGAMGSANRVVLSVARAAEADIREVSWSLHQSRLDAERVLRERDQAVAELSERAENLERTVVAVHTRLAQIEARPAMRMARRAQRLARRLLRRS